MNGSLVKWADAKIHIASHVIHYGSGVFEGARCYDTPKGSACFRLDAHTTRLYNSAKIYRMPIPIEPAALNQAIFDTIRANGFKACYIRPLVYRGYGEPGVSPLQSPVDVADPVLGMGRVPRARGAREGRGRPRELLDAQRARTRSRRWRSRARTTRAAA